MGLAVEIGDWTRFTGFTIGAVLGLVPTEFLRPNPLAGIDHDDRDSHARRLLIEAAWHHRKTYRHPGQVMRARWDVAPAAARIRGHLGNQRLHPMRETFTTRRKKPVIADIAVARNSPAGRWSLAVLE